jgi:acetoacetyl-CoA synthetase
MHPVGTQPAADDVVARARTAGKGARDPHAALGVAPGDRVVAYLPNTPEAVVAMLATASIGAVWSSCGPDFGARGVLDRYSQLEPRLIFCVDGYSYGGKLFDKRAEIRDIIAGLPTLAQVIHLP